jgi:glycosyltransferase involved in cell wall biosynthesis
LRPHPRGIANSTSPRRVLRVLLTNNTLSDRGGSELYVRDIALALRRRGHLPVAYSSRLGPVADELHSAGVPVIDDLTRLTQAPDVIRGQHHLEAAAAGLHFPETLAVHACHGWIPWQEFPLGLASVRRYVAVSQLTRERLVTSGVAPERVAIIPNFVDLDRFGHRRERRARMGKALVFGNAWWLDSPALSAIREACLRTGLDLESAGYGVGRPMDRPEDRLPSFDVVFAVGRSALEAMACGCAVILAEPQGFGGLVTTRNFHPGRAANFGLALTAGREATVEGVEAALNERDLADIADVSDLARSEGRLGQAMDLWEQQYRLAVAEGPRRLSKSSPPRHAI